MINWDEKYPRRDMGNGKIRAVGMGMAMQGSGISGMDVGSATLKVNDEGFYTLLIGAADMVPAATPRWPKLLPRCWNAASTISRSSVRTLTPRPTTPAPTHPAPPTSPAKRREVRAEAAEPDLQAGCSAAGLQRK